MSDPVKAYTYEDRRGLCVRCVGHTKTAARVNALAIHFAVAILFGTDDAEVEEAFHDCAGRHGDGRIVEVTITKTAETLQ